MATTPKKTVNNSLMLLICATLCSALFSSCTSSPKEDGVWIPMPKDTSALGRINHYIALDDLDKYKVQFRADRDTLSSKLPTLGFTKSEAFNKKGLVELLKDPRCVGIRVYYGVKERGKRGEFHIMMVGVDEQGKDLYIKKGSLMGGQAGGGDDKDGGLEFGQCEPPCDIDSIP